MCAASHDIDVAETWTLTKQAQNKLAAAQTNMERSMLSINNTARRANIWVREMAEVLDNQKCEKNEVVSTEK